MLKMLKNDVRKRTAHFVTLGLVGWWNNDRYECFLNRNFSHNLKFFGRDLNRKVWDFNHGEKLHSIWRWVSFFITDWKFSSIRKLMQVLKWVSIRVLLASVKLVTETLVKEFKTVVREENYFVGGGWLNLIELFGTFGLSVVWWKDKVIFFSTLLFECYAFD